MQQQRQVCITNQQQQQKQKQTKVPHPRNPADRADRSAEEAYFVDRATDELRRALATHDANPTAISRLGVEHARSLAKAVVALHGSAEDVDAADALLRRADEAIPPRGGGLTGRKRKFSLLGDADGGVVEAEAEAASLDRARRRWRESMEEESFVPRAEFPPDGSPPETWLSTGWRDAEMWLRLWARGHPPLCGRRLPAGFVDAWPADGGSKEERQEKVAAFASILARFSDTDVQVLLDKFHSHADYMDAAVREHVMMRKRSWWAEMRMRSARDLERWKPVCGGVQALDVRTFVDRYIVSRAAEPEADRERAELLASALAWRDGADASRRSESAIRARSSLPLSPHVHPPTTADAKPA
jgi:hypothetical protein